MGFVAFDGKAARDSHALGCDQNRANACYCGQRFLNPTMRDAHAVKCEKNPINRYTCQHCGETFVTQFGLFTTSGDVERDAHLLVCAKNPLNAACRHCNKVFIGTHGVLKFLGNDAHTRCLTHESGCTSNPKNRFHCEQCNRCFVTRQGWLQNTNGRAARDVHKKDCDVMPCSYEVVDADFTDWFLLSSGPRTEEFSHFSLMQNAVDTEMCDENLEHGFNNAEEIMLEEVESFHDVESLDDNDWDDVGFGKNVEKECLDDLGTMERSTDFLSEAGGDSTENVPGSDVDGKSLETLECTDAVTVDSWEEGTQVVPRFSCSPYVP